MTEIREVVSRYSMPRREFEERFPEFAINPLPGLDRIEIEEVYRIAAPGEVAGALLIEAPASVEATWTERLLHPLVLRGVRLASGRWLSQNLPPQQAPDAEHQAPAAE